jgi:hypothetical protein
VTGYASQYVRRSRRGIPDSTRLPWERAGCCRHQHLPIRLATPGSVTAGLERDDRLAAEYGVSQSSATRAINGDTYRDVPFPIRITDPGVPIEISYPYQAAISILATAPIDQRFTITIQPHTPTLRISGLLRLADQVWPAPPAPDPTATHRFEAPGPVGATQSPSRLPR